MAENENRETELRGALPFRRGDGGGGQDDRKKERPLCNLKYAYRKYLIIIKRRDNRNEVSPGFFRSR